MKKLIEFSKVIVHGGRSHADERLAVAIALAANNLIVPVYRRDPTAEEVEDCNTLVLDIGGQATDWCNTFDHHQLPREHAPACAFSLVAEAIGVAADLEAFFGWYSTWRTIDSKGPFQWAKANGVDWGVCSTLLNPENDLVGEWWEEAHDDIPVNQELVRRLQAQGLKILKAAEEFRGFSEKADAMGLPAKVADVAVFDFRSFTAQESQRYGLAYAKSKGATGGVIVSQDDRGPGYAYLRINDDPTIDFSQCANKEYCGFVHANGFILKTKGRDVANVEVIVDAKKEAAPAPKPEPAKGRPDYARLG